MNENPESNVDDESATFTEAARRSQALWEDLPRHPQKYRVLTGERPEPAFLISKPFQPAMVSAVASQALFFQRNSRSRPKAAAS